MFVLLEVDADIEHARGGEIERRRDPAAGGFAVRVADHLHAGGVAQRIVVHHVVDVVVIDLRLELRQQRRDHALLELQADVLAIELDAIHAAVGIGRLAVALGQRELDPGVAVGRPAQRQVGAPAGVGRMHLVAVAIRVVVGVRAGGSGICIEARVPAAAVRTWSLRSLLPTSRLPSKRAPGVSKRGCLRSKRTTPALLPGP